MKRLGLLFVFSLLALTGYSTSFIVGVKTSGKYDLKAKSYYIVQQDEQSDNNCSSYLEKCFSLHGSKRVYDKDKADFLVEMQLDTALSDTWMRSRNNYEGKTSNGTGGGTYQYRPTVNSQGEQASAYSAVISRDVSVFPSYDVEHHKIHVAEIKINAVDKKGKNIWRAKLSTEGKFTFEELFPVMFFASVGKWGISCSESVNVFSDEPAFYAFLQLEENPTLSLIKVGKSSKIAFVVHEEGTTMLVVPQSNRLDIKYKEDYSFIYSHEDSGNEIAAQGFRFCWDISGFIPLVEFHTYIFFKGGIENMEGNLAVKKKATGKEVVSYNLRPVLDCGYDKD